MTADAAGRNRTASGFPRGFFLTLEGIEGSGKTTHARGLETALGEAGCTVFLTREPGGTPIAEAMRALLLGAEGETPAPETELFMLLASRAQHVRGEIVPRLNRGEVVICDRFSDASLAYQGGGRGLGVDAVASANALATGGLEPDLTLLFDLPVEEALARVQRRGDRGGEYNRFDREAGTFYQNVRNTYLQLAGENSGRYVVLDATLPKAELHQAVRAAVEAPIQRGRETGAIA